MQTRRSFLAGIASTGVLATSARAEEDGAAAAARLVAAMGGADAWTRARGLTIAATHYESDLAQPYDNILWIDLDAPRMRFEGRSAWGMDRTRAVVGDRGWRVSEVSPLGPMTAQQVKGDLDWWDAHPYRNVRRLALGDATRRPRLGDGGRLELVRPDGSILMWYRQNPAGEPFAFGVGAGPAGVVLGPLAPVPGGARLPIWSARMDGTFRATGQKGRVLPTPPQVDWERP
ncbi:MAG: hypothetical protein ACOY5Y_18645 [Pseudomonadota bacterium]|jgi:hypothetical protein